MTTYYVDATTGNDGDDGLTPGNAWQTIARINGETFNAGNRILFKRGETWTAQLTIPSSGVIDNPIIFDAYGSGAYPIIIPAAENSAVSFSGISYVTMQNFVFDGTNIAEHVIFIKDASNHVKIKNSEVKNCALHSGLHLELGSDYNSLIRLVIHSNGTNDSDHGAYVESAYNLIEGCEVYGNFANGINIYSEDELEDPAYNLANYNIVRYCKVYDHNAAVGGTGILLSCGIDNLAHHNLAWDNRVGIQLAFGSESKIYSNTVYSCDDYGLRVSNNFIDGIVKNNISYGSGANDFLDQGTDTVASNNLLATDPKFANVGADNFHLEADSPARNAGIDVGLTRDYDSIFVPQEINPAIGAFEFRKDLKSKLGIEIRV